MFLNIHMLNICFHLRQLLYENDLPAAKSILLKIMLVFIRPPPCTWQNMTNVHRIHLSDGLKRVAWVQFDLTVWSFCIFMQLPEYLLSSPHTCSSCIMYGHQILQLQEITDAWKTKPSVNFHQLETPITSNPVALKNATFLLLMAEILHQSMDSLSHYLQGFRTIQTVVGNGISDHQRCMFSRCLFLSYFDVLVVVSCCPTRSWPYLEMLQKGALPFWAARSWGIYIPAS